MEQIKVEHRDPALYHLAKEDIAVIKVKNFKAVRKELLIDIERLNILTVQAQGIDRDFFYDILAEKNDRLNKIEKSINYFKGILDGTIDDKEKFDIPRIKSIPMDQIAEINAAGFFVHNPFRTERSPSNSLHWNKNKNTWFDFATGEGGDTIDYIMKRDSLTFPQACQYLSKFC